MTQAPKLGLYFAIGDHAGIGRRLLIVLIDFLVLAFLYYLSFQVAAAVDAGDAFAPWCFGLAFAYLAVLPATGPGTVGYLVAGVRLIDLYGKRASIWRSSFRFGFLVFGPLNLLADIIWLGGDPNRQSIRDKFAGTYVIRRRAQPAGSAPVRYKTYYMFNYNLVFPEVDRPTGD